MSVPSVSCLVLLFSSSFLSFHLESCLLLLFSALALCASDRRLGHSAQARWGEGRKAYGCIAMLMIRSAESSSKNINALQLEFRELKQQPNESAAKWVQKALRKKKECKGDDPSGASTACS